MRKIRSFNESVDLDKVWIVVVFDSGGFISDQFGYKSKLKAADKFIKLVNEEYETDFEPFLEDGERLFINVEDNPDFDRAIDYLNVEVESENGYGIEILEIDLE